MSKVTKKTLLITGGTGYLGSRLINNLVYEFNIICLYRTKKSINKILNLKKIQEKIVFISYENINYINILEKYNVNIILHCATNYGRNQEDENIVESNLLLPLKLLKASINFGCECFINTDTILDKRVSSYTLSKKHFRDWLIRYSNKINTINLRYEHFFGPNDDKSKFISWLIAEMKNNKKEIKLTKGNQQRDFIYIDDAVDATAHIIRNLKILNTDFDIDIGSGNLYKIREIVNLIKLIMKNDETTLKFGAIEYRENEVMKTDLNLEILFNKLHWKPKFSLEEGLVLSVKGTT